jgi:DNA-binding MarR family transcriptional regulator
VAAAVDAGLVVRAARAADRRRELRARSAEGRRASRAMHRQRQARFAAAMADWSGAEQATFAALLTRFVAAIEGQ